jgi:hypothetical protein
MGRGPGRRLVPFAVVSALALLACLAGGQLRAPWRLALGVPSGGLVALCFALLALSLAAILFFPRALSRRRAALVVVALSLAARLLWLPHPASDDVDRYLWEGRVLAAGLSPYAHAPRADGDPAADRFRDPADPVWRRINHPEMTAIYPPLMLALQAGVAAVAYDPLAVKAVMAGFDLATLVVLLGILGRLRAEPRWALLHGLSPVALLAFAGQGHNDAVQVFCLVGAIDLYQRRRWGWMWLLLGLAVQAKLVAVVAWPFFATRASWRWLWAGVAAAAAPALAALAADGGAVVESLLAFGYVMAFDGPVHGVLAAALGSNRTAAFACQGAYLLVYAAGLRLLHPSRTGAGPQGGLLFALGALLVLSPTVHFWYLSWLVPLAALRPTASWIALSGTVAFSLVPYGLESATGAWGFPWWGPWAVWALPALLLAREVRVGLGRARRQGRRAPAGPGPRAVSVVVPALDEAARIGACVAAIRGDASVIEVLGVAGGPGAGPGPRARAGGPGVAAHRAASPRGGGRGGQIAAGLARARGAVLAVVHADTRVAAGTFAAAVARLRAEPDLEGGAAGAVFDGPGATLRLLEVANDLRAGFLGLAFGDQVQFFRRRVVDLGLYPALPLMEDVELSLRLRGLGRVCFLWGDSLAGPARWQAGRAAARVLLVLRLVAWYLVRRTFGPPDAAALYTRYYGGRRP